MTDHRGLEIELNIFLGDFERNMQDASDLERKLSESARFIKRHKALVHRVHESARFIKRHKPLVHKVQVFMEKEDEGDSDEEDVDDEAALRITVRVEWYQDNL